MNQIAKMFIESNARLRQITKGEYNVERMAAAQREFEGQIRLLNAVFSAYGIASKNKRAMVGLERMNIMDDSTAVDLMLGDPNEDKIKCPEVERLISRADCLDKSGEINAPEECKGCDIGKATKKMLLHD